MFDLNELPEGDGFYPIAAKGECEVAVATTAEDVFGNDNSNKIVCRLLRDDEAADTKDASASKPVLPPAGSSTVAYPDEDWEAEELARYDAANRAVKSPVRVGGAPEIQRGLETTLLERIETLAETSPGFGISPRPEKLGQRTNIPVEKRSDLTTDFFQRAPGKLDVRPAKNRLGDSVGDDECNLDSRSLLYPGSASRKGKRVRDDDLVSGQPTPDLSGPKLKRPGRSVQNGTNVEVSRGAGPSLSLIVDRDLTEVVAPTSSNQKSHSVGEISIEEEAATSLSLGETSLKTEVAQGPENQSLSTVKPALGLSISTNVRTSVNRETETSVSTGIVDPKVLLAETDTGKSEKEVSARVQIPDVVKPEQPFWFGQLRGDSFGLTDVAAYCSEPIPPTSYLRSLPQVLMVEKVSRLQELFEAIRQGPADEPIIRIKHPPSPANSKMETFGCMFQPQRNHKQGITKAGSSQVELHLGLRNGSADRDMGPPGFTNNNEQFVVVVKFKDSKLPSNGRRSSKKLYLVLDTVAEVACDTDGQFRNKFEREIIDHGNVEESTLYGILCHPPDRDRSAESVLADVLIPEVASAIESVPSVDSPKAVQPDTTTGKIDVLSEKRLSSLVERRPSVDPVDRDSLCSVARTEFVETSAKDFAHLLKSKDKKETAVESSHEVRRSEKSKVRKDDGSKERQRDRESRGKERERDGRSGTKDVHRHTHRSSERIKESDPFKRDRSKDKDTDRFKEKERDRHRDSHREVLERSKRVRELEREKQEKQREKEKVRDREKEKERDRDRSARKRDRLAAELDKAKGEEKKMTPDSERPAPGFGPPAPGFSLPAPDFSREGSSGLGAATLSGKDIRRRGKIVDEDVAFEEKYGFELKTTLPERDPSVSKKSAHSSKTDHLDDIAARCNKDEDATGTRKECAVDVDKLKAKKTDSQSGLPDLKTGNVTASKEVDKAVKADVIKENLASDRLALASASDSRQQASEGSRTVHANLKGKMGNLGLSGGTKVVDTSVLSDIASTSGKVTDEAMDIDGEPRGLESVQGRKNPDMPKVQVTEFNSSFMKSDVQSVVNVGTTSKLQLSGRASNLDMGRKEGMIPVDSSGNGVTSKGLTNTKEVFLPPKPKVALSVRVENMFEAAQVRKYDDNGGGQEVDPSLGPVDKSTHAGTEDVQAAQLTGQYSPSTMDNGSVTPVASVEKDVTLDVVLQGCDKETRVWLLSKYNDVYLAEEFGVRILKIEEIPSAKIDARPKLHQGPVNVKVSLATDKSTDASEARWFINQAADMLRAVASRGVFAKCLWYQGPVQRFSDDQAPSIPAVVKKVKGEDGKNLERIQEVTGVMIGIVLDASNKKGIVNSSRVIGLRLKCVRKRGFVEATRRVEELLVQVADRFSKDIRGGAAGSQDVGLSKLKVDCFSNTSPSSGILTPLQKDVFAAYSPVSPVAAPTPLASFKSKLHESSIEVKTFSACPTAVPSTSHTEFVSAVNLNPPATFEEIHAQSQQNISEDEDPDRALRQSDSKSGCSRPLQVSNLPSFASAPMLKELFEEVLKNKYGLPSGYDGLSELVLDINLDHENHCAFVEFASDELLKFIIKAYAEDRKTFCDLKLELGSSTTLKSERQYLTGKIEASGSAVEFGGGSSEPFGLTRVRRERILRRIEEPAGRFAGVGSSTDSDCDVYPQERRYGSSRDPTVRFPGRSLEKPKPLFLTELMRHASARSLSDLFEDIIKKYINPSLGSFKGRQTVLDVRYIPSRGCAFVDLATPELVDFMLDLHKRKPEVFFHMKMEIGRRPLPGQSEEEIQPPHIVKRLNAPTSRYALLPDESYSSAKRPRRQFASISPPRREVTVMEQDYVDEYDEDEEEDRQQNGARKRRSDPERTVYADRLPENASEGMIQRIFERVLREHLTEEQRELMGDHLITEVRYVPTKFCAFVVFVGEDLTRLVLQLYNQDEDIFENMRLKPHFHSRMEDLYREDLHERDDGSTHRVLTRDTSLLDRRRIRGIDDYYHSADVNDHGRGRVPTAHRAVAATAFKEVDRRRSVYVDRIPERLPEPKMRDMFERALRQNRHAFNTHLVSQVTFFRDKFDPDKLCAFVELENEELVQDLLEVYTEDEEAFNGMRVRPAVKFGGH